MIEGSVVITLFKRLCIAFMTSIPVRILNRLFHAIGQCARGSKVIKWFVRPTNIDSRVDTSFFYGLLRKVWNSILQFFSRLYARIAGLNNGSLNNRLYNRLIKPSFFLHLSTLLFIGVLVIFIIPHNYWNNLYALLFVLGLCGLYFLCLLSGRKDLGRQTNGLWVPFLFFVFITTISVYGSHDMQDSLRSLAFFGTSFLLALVIYGILSSEKRIETFLGVMTWTMAVVSIGAMIQRILGIEQDILLTDMNLNQGMPGRAYSTLGNPNNLAEFLMLFIPFAYVWATTRKKDLTKLLGLFLVGVGVLALILTYSRSGWLAFAIAATIFTILYKRQIFPALIVLILCCIPLLPQTVLNRIMTIGNLKDTSSSYRVNIWSSVLRMLKGRWIQGVGLGTGSFRAIYPSYSVGMTGAAPHSHMQFLEVLIEMGILGLLSLLWYSLS